MAEYIRKSKKKNKNERIEDNVKPNLLNRNFTTDAPNKVWDTDVTYLIFKGSRAYLSTIIDLYDRHVVAYKISKHNDNKYLLIIEGQASKNSEAWTDRNYDLSFERAYSLMKYWKDVCGINFGKNCEVQIAGSGDGRYNIETMRDKMYEVNNQRFLIHIIPKNIIEDEKK